MIGKVSYSTHRINADYCVGINEVTKQLSENFLPKDSHLIKHNIALQKKAAHMVMHCFLSFDYSVND